MYFLSDFGDHLEFSKGRKKGSRDRKKRKSKVGSMMIPAIPGGAAIGMLPAAGYAAIQIARKKPINVKSLTYGTLAGIGLGGIGGVIVGDKLDKRMKTGRYEYGLSDSLITFKKGRGRDRKKRIRRKNDNNNNNLRENINTGTSTVRTGINTTKEVRGVSREVRGWISLANRLGVI